MSNVGKRATRELGERRSDETRLRHWLERVDDRFMGTPLDVHPHEALLQCLRITAGEVRYCDQQIRRLEEDELFERPATETLAVMPSGRVVVAEEKRGFEVISRWVQWRSSALDRLARYSKMALDVGIEERQIQLAEREADLIGRYFEAVLGDLELTPAQQKALGPAMRRHLSLVEKTGH